jgi:hypothetical protein
VRYDKYDPFNGGTRAFLANDFYAGTANASDPLNPGNWNKLYGAYLDANGAVKAPKASPSAGDIGSTPTGKLIGVYLVSDDKKAGDVVDIMTSGEVVEMDDGKYAGVTASQDWFIDPATGLLKLTTPVTTPAAGTNYFYVGTTVEVARLVVRCQKVMLA